MRVGLAGEPQGENLFHRRPQVDDLDLLREVAVDQRIDFIHDRLLLHHQKVRKFTLLVSVVSPLESQAPGAFSMVLVWVMACPLRHGQFSTLCVKPVHQLLDFSL